MTAQQHFGLCILAADATVAGSTAVVLQGVVFRRRFAPMGNATGWSMYTLFCITRRVKARSTRSGMAGDSGYPPTPVSTAESARFFGLRGRRLMLT